MRPDGGAWNTLGSATTTTVWNVLGDATTTNGRAGWIRQSRIIFVSCAGPKATDCLGPSLCRFVLFWRCGSRRALQPLRRWAAPPRVWNMCSNLVSKECCQIAYGAFGNSCKCGRLRHLAWHRSDSLSVASARFAASLKPASMGCDERSGQQSVSTLTGFGGSAVPVGACKL